MSILLVGAEGQVGQELQKTLPRLAATFGPVVAVGRSQLDLTDLDAIAAQVEAIQPSLIVNAAAYTAVDKAESEPELAHRINAEAPEALAKAAAKCGAALVHISTDYVFSGQKPSPRKETDEVGPLSMYGKTKLAGEEAIRQVLDRHVILRTAWVYGVYGKGNFVKTMLRLAKDRSELSVVADQIGSPTWAKDIADTITEISENNLDQRLGTYHFTDSDTASWHEFAEAIFEEAKALGMPLAIETVHPITTAEYPTPAARPPYSVLNCEKVAAVLGHSAPKWRVSLQQMLKQYMSES
ncbi:MAG: dTDP-4-dehydrorhamnose reductase [Cyanobacteria bacterium J06621_11]